MVNRFLDVKRHEARKRKEKPTLLLFTGEDGSRLQDFLTGVSTRQEIHLYYINHDTGSQNRRK